MNFSLEPTKIRRLYAAAALLWIAAFFCEAWGIAFWSETLARANSGLAGSAQALDEKGAAIRRTIAETKALSEDLEFLQSLPDVLPRDKGVLRTQKAIEDEVEGLRQKLSRQLKGSLYILVDAKANKLYVKKGFQLLWQADCSVGKGGSLYDRRTGRRWQFVTPRGEFRVLSKAVNPLWRKPDWAYVEAGQPIPPPDDPSRLVSGELGAYLLNLGDGYLIHGTKDEKILGRPASHGCVRLGADDLKFLYDHVPIGTRVFIFY